MNQTAQLQRLDAAPAIDVVDQLVALYVDVYADTGDPFFGEGRYRQQLASHMQAPGWEAVAASVDGTQVGYIYGFSLPAKTKWWRGLLDPAPPGFTHEDGQRTVAISEILVAGPWRRQGIARRLHDEFVAGRPERRATLLVEADNNPAYSAYLAWGWRHVNRLRPKWDGAPTYHVLMRTLQVQA